ncbi:hypothetical protein KQI61_06080 [Anaerocolumna aminovalerica]|uniref:hypothetical protein n=1 Tax=Anaerocolumna aminovalerica TaxID=1527 RepID=UPI001C0F2724|nr:hypothetical protein [Anaerocolumna aminovalerica]MBU5331759.1 hypothetical protein [Anaerocolumna aminovalerica]
MIKKIKPEYKVNVTGCVPNVIMTKINELVDMINEQQKIICNLQKQINQKANFINPMFPD